MCQLASVEATFPKCGGVCQPPRPEGALYWDSGRLYWDSGRPGESCTGPPYLCSGSDPSRVEPLIVSISIPTLPRRPEVGYTSRARFNDAGRHNARQ